MKFLARPLALSAVPCLLAGVALLAGAGESDSGARPERLVRASITIDGQVVLRASTSDDGRPDADAVWSYLLERLEFEPTEAFSALNVDAASEAFTIGWLKSRANEHRGEPPTIALDVTHGGQDAPFRLGLVRSAGRGAWRVDRQTVERRFPHRRITRAEAARLTDPRRVK